MRDEGTYRGLARASEGAGAKATSFGGAAKPLSRRWTRTDLAPSWRETRSFRDLSPSIAPKREITTIHLTVEFSPPEDVKKAHPKASVLKGGRVVFNIKANDYRLIALVQYVDGVLMIRFFGSHEEYDGIDAETV
jgi:mRNA interferase HigB